MTPTLPHAHVNLLEDAGYQARRVTTAQSAIAELESSEATRSSPT